MAARIETLFTPWGVPDGEARPEVRHLQAEFGRTPQGHPRMTVSGGPWPVEVPLHASALAHAAQSVLRSEDRGVPSYPLTLFPGTPGRHPHVTARAADVLSLAAREAPDLVKAAGVSPEAVASAHRQSGHTPDGRRADAALDAYRSTLLSELAHGTTLREGVAPDATLAQTMRRQHAIRTFSEANGLSKEHASVGLASDAGEVQVVASASDLASAAAWRTGAQLPLAPVARFLARNEAAISPRDHVPLGEIRPDAADRAVVRFSPTLLLRLARDGSDAATRQAEFGAAAFATRERAVEVLRDRSRDRVLETPTQVRSAPRRVNDARGR